MANTKASFFSRVESFFKKTFGSSKWEKTAEVTLTIIAPMLETATMLAAGGPAEALVAAGVATAQKDLAAAVVLIDDVSAGGTSAATGPAQVVSVLNAVRTDLPQLLSAAEVKSAPNAAEITAVFKTITDEVDAILNGLPAAAVAAATVAAK